MKAESLYIAAARSGLIYILLTGLAWLFLIRIIPPPGPILNADAIAGFYAAHRTGILFGSILMLFSIVFFIVYGTVVHRVFQVLEGGQGLLANSTLVSFGMGAVITMLTAIFWGTAAFRPERSAELILVLNDLGWLFFFAAAPPIFMIFASTAYLSLTSKETGAPTLPRWYGMLNLWVVFAIVPGPFALVFKSGPLAWDGLVVFWLAAAVYSAVFLLSPKVMVPAVRKHLLSQPQSPA